MANMSRVFSCLVFAAALVDGAMARTYVVGDDMGWKIPPEGEDEYRNWSDSKKFDVGDTIVFNWNGTHTVVEVPEEGYEACRLTNALSRIQIASPAHYTLDSYGSRYFICTVDNHCSLGQKVEIRVGSSPPLINKTAFFSSILLALATSFLTLM